MVAAAARNAPDAPHAAAHPARPPGIEAPPADRSGGQEGEAAAEETAARERSYETRYYTVQEGDSVYNIAAHFDLKSDTLLSFNQLGAGRLIHPGDKLRVPSVDGLVHVVQNSDTLEDISLAYKVEISEIVSANEIADRDAISVGQKLFLPNAKKPKSSSYGPSYGAMVFSRPASGRISSKYGMRTHPVTGRWQMHAGIDIACGHGARILAARSGVVTHTGRLGGYGNLVVIQHDNGYSTRYGHLSRINVRRGQRVRERQTIGRAGSTGVTTGPHLHFEVRLNSKAINPIRLIR